jgi:hypothetical protein
MASWKRLSEQGLAKVNAALRTKGLQALTAEEIRREPPEDSEGSGVEIE